MKLLISALQDSVMFLVLLGAQVIIVASLAMTALWLYFKRLKASVVEEAGLEAESSDDPVSQPLAEVNEIHLSLIRDLESKIAGLEKEKLELTSSSSSQDLEAEKQKTQELKKLNEEIVQKAQGLESKLLEYEVIKDEIGLLSTVKTENQKLKETVSELESQISKWQNEKSVEAKVEMKEEPKVDSPKVEEFQPINQIAAAADADPGIEGLLNEIEALTSEKKELQRKKA